MIEYLQERFAPGPLFGWLCLVFALSTVAIWLRARSRRRGAVRFSTASFLVDVRPSLATRARFLLPLLRTLAVLSLIVAMARPQAGGEYRDTGEGIAIQMVLDVSGSMAEEDFKLNGRPVRRLDAVKQVFRDFVLGSGGLRGREGDLIGMTSFAAFADTQCPLTPDHGALIDLMNQTEIPGWVDGEARRGNIEANFTAIGDAVVLATDDLRRAGELATVGVPGADAAKSRVMILLTDGANNPAQIEGTKPPDPLEAAKIAGKMGIRIYTIGAAGEESTERGFGFLTPRQAPFDEQLLKSIADASGGKYFRATDTESLRTIYEEIDRLEKRKTGERSFRDDVFAARVCMIGALGLLLTELFLANTRFRKLP